jgi:hypothetical protein
LIKIDPTDASSTQVVGALGFRGINWLAYDPRTDDFVAHDRNQMYRIDRQTGQATPTDQMIGVPQAQGVDYVPGLGVITAFGSVDNARSLGTVDDQGLVNPLFLNLPVVAEIDEVMWDHTRSRIYATAFQDGLLYSFDEETGDLIDTITLGVSDGSIARGTVNPDSGIMFDVSRASEDPTLTISRRDPVTGNVIDTIGSVTGFEQVMGLAFVPEPSSALLVVVAGVFALRRNR